MTAAAPSLELPPLPDGEIYCHGATVVYGGEYFTAAQMQDYARAALQADPDDDAEAVAYIHKNGRDVLAHRDMHQATNPADWAPLYTAPPTDALPAADGLRVACTELTHGREPTDEAPPKRCENCDGTGDVHRADGEYLGKCPWCDEAPPKGDGLLPSTLFEVRAEWYELCERAAYVDKLKISGKLAEAIVATVVAAGEA